MVARYCHGTGEWLVTDEPWLLPYHGMPVMPSIFQEYAEAWLREHC